MNWRVFVAAGFVLVTATAAHADEFRLKDGSKISGTIVGFEGDEFKVQTSYGFAMIRKDSIAEIIPSAAKKTTPPNDGATKPAESAPPPKTQVPADAKEALHDRRVSPAPALKPEVLTPAPVTPAPNSSTVPPATAASTPPKSPSAAKASTLVPSPAAAPTASAAASSEAGTASTAPTVPAVAAAPPPEPKLQPIQETIRGNLYLNQTFGFQMYRPPGWDLIADAGKALPNAITALGTSDETTLLVVGHDALTASLDAHASETERKLHDIYQNYRLLSTAHTTISGFPAVETRFRGALGDKDWSVAVVTLARGKEAFTFLAMTYADSDLIQIQENVIAKAIASLQFTSSY